MSAVVVQKSSHLVATRSMSWKGYENFKRLKLTSRRLKVGGAWAELYNISTIETGRVVTDNTFCCFKDVRC